MIAKGSGYVRGNREAARARLGSHFKYVEHRSMDLEYETRDDRRIFSKDQDVVSRRDAVDDVMEHTSTSVNYHKVVLSPGEDEPIHDWREWTREVMADLEERQGKELHWYAVVHQNTDNPHVHVVIAGAGEDHETGEIEPVKLYADDYRAMRESGHEHSEYDWHHRISELVKEYDTLERDIPTVEHTLERDLGGDGRDR
jgi:type IV secretory pathway VirD2 relaxase